MIRPVELAEMKAGAVEHPPSAAGTGRASSSVPGCACPPGSSRSRRRAPSTRCRDHRGRCAPGRCSAFSLDALRRGSGGRGWTGRCSAWAALWGGAEDPWIAVAAACFRPTDARVRPVLRSPGGLARRCVVHRTVDQADAGDHRPLARGPCSGSGRRARPLYVVVQERDVRKLKAARADAVGRTSATRSRSSARRSLTAWGCLAPSRRRPAPPTGTRLPKIGARAHEGTHRGGTDDARGGGRVPEQELAAMHGVGPHRPEDAARGVGRARPRPTRRHER